MAQKDSPHLVERDRGTLRLLQPRPRLLNFSRRNRPSHQLGRERDPDRHSLRSLCDSLVQSSTVPHGASPGCPDGSQTPTPSIGHRPIRGLLSRRLRTTRPTLTWFPFNVLSECKYRRTHHAWSQGSCFVTMIWPPLSSHLCVLDLTGTSCVPYGVSGSLRSFRVTTSVVSICSNVIVYVGGRATGFCSSK